MASEEVILRSKRGQVTIFVIIALVIIVLGSAYFIFKDNLFSERVSPTFEPVETSFLNCLEGKTNLGIKILGTQGGYIEPPEFVSGSDYMPFSSELNFFGARIPYWYSVSGNNIPLNQVPSKTNMEIQLSEYIENQIESCSFESFDSEGFLIERGNPEVEVSIEENFVRVFTDMDLSLQKGEESVVISNHQVEINSKIGKLYDEAVEFYELERKDMFLENYSIDVLRLYAPVDGFELSCAPLIWDADEIFSDLKNATRDNFLAMKNFGEGDDYFNLKLSLDSDVRVINFEDWSSTYEVEPADSSVLIAKPVGNEPGLGILGFCYVPYHFIYDMKYPVLIQLTQGEEVFQFPLAIIIENNVPVGLGSGTSSYSERIDLCKESAKSNITIELVDSSLNPVDGSISYQCFSSSCQVGNTINGKFSGEVPQCVNGEIIVRSSGYRESSETFSTVNSGSLTVMMDKIYEKEVVLKIANSNSREKSVITFSSDNGDSYTLLYPDTKEVNLSEGNYNIRVYVYDNSSIEFPASTTEQCYEVPSGIGGIFGITRQECQTINIPEQEISNVLVAGGSSEFSFSERVLSSQNIIEISTEKYNNPQTIEEVQIIYSLVEGKGVGIRLI